MRTLHISSAITVTIVTLAFSACGPGSGQSASGGGAGSSKGGSSGGNSSSGSSSNGSGSGSSGSHGGAASGGAGSSGGTGGASASSSTSGGSGANGGTSSAIPFAGAGSTGQGGLITSGISPESCTAASAFNGSVVTPVGGDNLTCFYSSSVSPTLPLAFIEQDEEIIGGKDLIHVRLTMNPTFVDNTYGSTAIGWSGSDAGTMMMGPGMHGHSFWDLIDSDHCEFDFKNASGDVVLSFNMDYCSADANAPSGFACLGVSGGDGGMLIGSASDIVYYNTSLGRDLNACGYGSYTTNSPATDANYDANPATPNWDYRVVYDVWVSKAALPSGWSVSIPYVHASPSKMASTYTVTAAPCPPLNCVGEGCTKGGECVGDECDGGFAICTGEGCDAGGQCVGLLCDGGSPTQCLGEGCNSGGNSVTPEGGTWCSPSGSACTDNSACCSLYCTEGQCF